MKYDWGKFLPLESANFYNFSTKMSNSDNFPPKSANLVNFPLRKFKIGETIFWQNIDLWTGHITTRYVIMGNYSWNLRMIKYDLK